MTEQEAIKHIKYLKRLFTDTGNKINENTACDIAIAALEKQIPKKVIKKTENDNGFKIGYCACPNCGKWVVKPISRNGCNNCLQRLDWSDI